MMNNLIELDSKQAWLRLIIIFTMSVIGTAGMWSVVIIMPNIQNEFELDRAVRTSLAMASISDFLSEALRTFARRCLAISNVFIGTIAHMKSAPSPI